MRALVIDANVNEIHLIQAACENKAAYLAEPSLLKFAEVNQAGRAG